VHISFEWLVSAYAVESAVQKQKRSYGDMMSAMFAGSFTPKRLSA